MPEEEVFAVARGKSLDEPTARGQRLLSYFRELPRERQDDFLRIAHTLHREHSVKALNHQKNKLRDKKSD